MPLTKLINPPVFTGSNRSDEERDKHIHAVAFLGERPDTLEIANQAMTLRMAHDEKHVGELVNERLGVQLKAWEAKCAALENELAEARSKNADLEAQVSDKLRSDLLLNQATQERDAAILALASTRGQLTAAGRNLELLEGLCGVRGVDPTQAIIIGAPPLPCSTIAAYETRLAAAKTPTERNVILDELEAAHAQGRISK